ncbi:MAG: hypothetical protein CL785_03950 [Chloroflexi bacterium]|nr:hypothetical protein [Chloroflexota bacterium]|tara:strand:+ start:3193 stop:4911 length:1719 start_codon:yes stop_codon:yes gene_type:complete
MIINENVYIPMRDTTHLAADIYLPNNNEKFPSILIRSPYGKDREGTLQGASRWVKRGYVVVVQDCRGTGNSEGDYHYYLDDADDGHDSVEWISKTHWSNGKVGIVGTSYSANAGYLLAPTQPNGLTAMICALGTSNNYLDGRWRGGVWHVAHAAHWAQLVEVNTGPKPLPKNSNLSSETIDRIKKITIERARKTVKRMQLGQGNPLATDFLMESYHHSKFDDYWKAQSIDDKYAHTVVPTLHIAGWYDQFQRGNLENYKGMKNNPNAGPQMLIIGPWFHGKIDTPFISQIEEQWLDYWMKDENNSHLLEFPVKIFVVGANPDSSGPQEGIWRFEKEWPLKRTEFKKFYLNEEKSGSVQSLNDGSLKIEIPNSSEKIDVIDYNPVNENLPGNIGFRSLAIGANNPGSNQLDDEVSGQVLTYSTSILEEDLEITGEVLVELYISSTAVDQVWAVNLTNVYPDGTSWLCSDGILKASHNNSHSNPTKLEPNQIHKLEIEIWPMSQVFKKGNRIRIDIMNANFPKTEPCPYPSLNSIYHSKDYPSSIILPVIPANSGGKWFQEDSDEPFKGSLNYL